MQHCIEMIGQALPLADNWQITFGWETTAHLFPQTIFNLSKLRRGSFVTYMIDYMPVYSHDL
jgi:hypothetical protein